MRDTAENRNRGRARAWLAPVVAIATAGGLAGCGLLDVENPNNLVQEDIEKPQAGGALANGAMATAARGLTYYAPTVAAAGDDAMWVGSRDGWGDLDRGNVANPSNEFTDGAFDFMAEARWMADEAIDNLRAQDAEGTIVDRGDLGRALLWGGIMYTYIPDWLEDFAFSDRGNSAPPIGEANMDGVYDEAIQNLTESHSILSAEGSDFEAAWAMAQRARAKHGKAVWQMLNPPGSVPSNPLVGSGSGAEADALAALALVDGSLTVPVDVRFEFNFSAATIDNDMGWQINERLELRFGDRYIVANEAGTRRASTRLLDPIDGVEDPAADAFMDRWEAGGARPRDASWTVTSAREMYLIVAESKLAGGDMAGFVQAINTLRSLDDQTPYDPATHDATLATLPYGKTPAMNLLIHSRFANLMLTGRLLNDHHRFGYMSDRWLPSSIAATVPGTIMPISIGERQSNVCISQPGSC